MKHRLACDLCVSPSCCCPSVDRPAVRCARPHLSLGESMSEDAGVQRCGGGQPAVFRAFYGTTAVMFSGRELQEIQSLNTETSSSFAGLPHILTICLSFSVFFLVFQMVALPHLFPHSSASTTTCLNNSSPSPFLFSCRYQLKS